MENMIRVDKTTLYGMDRFKEIVTKKRMVDVGEVAQSCMLAIGMLEEFKFLTYTMLTLIVELHNYNNLHKIIDSDLKEVIKFFKGVCKSQGVNYSKELEEAFNERYNKFNKINKTLFINEYQKEHEYLAEGMNSLCNVMLIIGKQFHVVLKHLDYKDEFIKHMDLVTDFMVEIKPKLKPKKVSKYQNLVGKNLKNWRVE
jgi:hypothetical protein